MQSTHQSPDDLRASQPSGHAATATSQSTSMSRRMRSDVDSWIEVSSQPSNSSLSSIADDIVTTGLQVQHSTKARRPTLRPSTLTNPDFTRQMSNGGTSSQEEYEESESEEDRTMTSSGEGLMPLMAPLRNQQDHGLGGGGTQTARRRASMMAHEDDEDESRTAINYPIRSDSCFTPQPNAFSHPPSTTPRHASQPAPGSYFPPSRPLNTTRHSSRHSLPNQLERRHSHLPQNPLSPSFNAASQHDEALRASLTGLLSVAAAARSLPKGASKTSAQPHPPPRSNRVDPISFHLIPESALPRNSPQSADNHEPTFRPTLRPSSTRTSSNSDRHPSQGPSEHKRKATAAATTNSRSSSRERRALKKARRAAALSAAADDFSSITPTLFTWVVSAGVLVVLSALSFSAGYGIGRESGRVEGMAEAMGRGEAVGDMLHASCAREAGRSGMGLKRSLARSAIQA